MTYKPGWIAGRYSAICDVCGFRFHSDRLKRRWDSLMVCEQDWETRHPQDFIKLRSEKITPDWVREEPIDAFLNVCTIVTVQGKADWGTAGCAQAGNNLFQSDWGDFGTDTVAEVAIAGDGFAGSLGRV